MSPRIKSGPGRCSRCNKTYVDLLEHITKRHQQEHFHQDELDGTGLLVCICGRVVLNTSGLIKHQLRFGCLGTQHRSTGRSLHLAHPSDVSSSLTSLSPSAPTGHQTPPVPSSPHRYRPNSLLSSSLTPLTSDLTTASMSTMEHIGEVAMVQSLSLGLENLSDPLTPALLTEMKDLPSISLVALSAPISEERPPTPPGLPQPSEHSYVSLFAEVC